MFLFLLGAAFAYVVLRFKFPLSVWIKKQEKAIEQELTKD